MGYNRWCNYAVTLDCADENIVLGDGVVLRWNVTARNNDDHIVTQNRNYKKDVFAMKKAFSICKLAEEKAFRCFCSLCLVNRRGGGIRRDDRSRDSRHGDDRDDRSHDLPRDDGHGVHTWRQDRTAYCLAPAPVLLRQQSRSRHRRV